MNRTIKYCAYIILALLIQIVISPAYFKDPFQPNLLIIFVIYLGLTKGVRGGWAIAFLLGLVQDCFSGIYLGMEGFIYLLIFLLLRNVADRLYTDNAYLMILTAFFMTLANGLLQLLLLLMFSAAQGIFGSLLSSLLPQALVNALVASLVFRWSLLEFVGERR